MAITITRLNAPDAKVELNGNEEYSVPSGDTQNINLLDQNGDSIAVDSVSGDDVSINTHWQRNPDWLPLPEINVGDNRFVGLYAVFEDEPIGNEITLKISQSGNTISWGDGTTVTSTTSLMTHQYNYATILSPVLSMNGRNYKMVIVDIDITSVDRISLGFKGSVEHTTPTGWLDIICASSSLEVVEPSTLINFDHRISSYLERLLVLESTGTSTRTISDNYQYLSRLKVLEIPFINTTTSIQQSFEYSGNQSILDSSSAPISINNPYLTNMSSAFRYSYFTELGDIIVPNCSNFSQSFRSSNLRIVGNCDFSSATSLSSLAVDANLVNIGTITITNLLTSLRFAFRRNYFLNALIFSGDLSNVTDTTGIVVNCYLMTRLILPNLVIGFDISDTQITGQNLQDLFDSLGTANGTQTITLPNFTSGEDTSIATNKGFTIAYA